MSQSTQDSAEARALALKEAPHHTAQHHRSAVRAPHQDTAAARRGARHRVSFWAVAAAFLAVSALSALPSPLYGLYRQRDGFSPFTLTLIYAAYAVGIVASLFFVGHLSDWYGRRRILLPALGVAMLAAVVFLLWPALPGLVVGRVLSGLALGAVTATATAYLGELHARHRPQASARRPQVVALVAYVGGLGLGAFVAGLLARYVAHPLIVPYVVILIALLLTAAGVALAPETRTAGQPRPPYRPQRVSVPRDARGRYLAAVLGVLLANAPGGLFTALSGTFLATVLHRTSPALAGTTLFVAFASAVLAQLTTAGWPARRGLLSGVPGLLAGLALTVAAVWLPTPSFALFLIGGAVTGASIGAMNRATLATIVALAPAASRAESVAGFFLASYIGVSVPVIGVGLALQYISPRLALLVFAVAVAVCLLAATPTLLGSSQAQDVTPPVAAPTLSAAGRRER